MGTPLSLCGLSLGAVLCLHYAAQKPDSVFSLVLIAPQVHPPRRLLQFQNLIFRLMPENAFAELGLPKESVLSLMSSMADLDLTPIVGNIRAKTLILCGSADRANRTASERLAEQIPGAGFRLVPDAGHEVNVQNPTALSALLTQFQ